MVADVAILIHFVEDGGLARHGVASSYWWVLWSLCRRRADDYF